MKKRMIAAAMVMALGIVWAGCGSESASTEEEIAVVIAGAPAYGAGWDRRPCERS